MTYERAKVVPFKAPKKKERELSIVPNPAFAVCMIDLVFKQKGMKDRPCIRMSGDAYDVFKSVWNPDTIDLREEGKVMYLNRANYVLSVFDLSQGGITGTVMDPRHVIVAALLQNATSIVLAHNHPSGSLKPSRQDEELTTKTKFAANYHDIKVLDHLILSGDGYFSFADEGLCL